jgi:hypothetical protein
MKPIDQLAFAVQDTHNRRTFLQRAGLGLGLVALRSLAEAPAAMPGPFVTHAPRARRIIFLHQSGAPSQVDMFDHKPGLAGFRGQDLPASVRMGQRLTGMTAGQATLPVWPSPFAFQRHGESGVWLSEPFRHFGKSVDQVCFLRSLHTEAINHDPAITFVQTGSQIAGRPCMGAWVSYGLGSENRDLPAFVVLTSTGTGRPEDQPLYDRLWGAGFLPSKYQGVRFRAGNEPVLYLNDPPGVSRDSRRAMLDGVAELNQLRHATVGDPEIQTRIAQYEMAFRMQSSVPELTDRSGEPAHVLDLYGPEVRRPGSFAANCLLARRLAERNVRFIQLYHRGWDQHFYLRDQIEKQIHDIDQPCHALLTDLRQRGLLDDTLVVFAGEFGRTVYAQGDLNAPNVGRDHHPKCFTGWMAGAGVKPGISFGETDDFSYNVARDPVSVFDLQATILHLLGIDHTRLTFRYQGRDFRLTDVHGEVVKPILT